MRILIKFPSRERPEKLKETFLKYVAYANDPSNISFLVSLDTNDQTVTKTQEIVLKMIHPNTTVVVGEPCGKIGAVNRDMEMAPDFDILLLASDDMIPVKQGYDQIIRDNMLKYYPDTDGVLFFNDGHVGRKLNTLCILGKKYYNRFGYIYHPAYKSEWCDNEFMTVADMLRRQTYFEEVIIEHVHPAWVKNVQWDELNHRNDAYRNIDAQTFLDRKAHNFDFKSLNVFSFCLFGNKPKYVRGMHENIRMIANKFPDWLVYLYYSADVPVDEFKSYDNVILKNLSLSGFHRTAERFYPIDDPNIAVMMVRDTDSRINDRDEWCIREFLKSDKMFHIIRDNRHHTMDILAGLWGIKRNCIPDFSFEQSVKNTMHKYGEKHGCDQEYLQAEIYPKIKNTVLIHGSVRRHLDEQLVPITLNTTHMFCGQPIEIDDQGNEYHECKYCETIT